MVSVGVEQLNPSPEAMHPGSHESLSRCPVLQGPGRPAAASERVLPDHWSPSVFEQYQYC